MTIISDPAPLFERYEILAREADTAFSRVKDTFPQCLSCHEGCSDCCHALFDLPLVEAAYLNHIFVKAFPSGQERSAIMERAHDADRKIHTIKRRAFKAEQAGEDINAILASMAKERIRCPLLDSNDRCVLYAARPITCRVYGIPTAVGGKGHVCGKSAFVPGKAYPTVNLDRIHERLASLSLEFASHMKSEYSAIHTVLVPVSMALTTTYDTAYYGIGKNRGRNRD